MMPKPIASLFLLLASLAIWQLDAAAAQSASPKLLWCASPLSPASLESPSDSWVDVPDTRVALELPNEAVVLISYDVAVSHVTDVQPEGVSQVSELFFRVAVDGSPYRQSATTVDDREPLVTTASGFLVLEIPRGHHDVKLQWRKRGTHVIKWAVASDILDGFAGGRNLIVSAQHRFIWHTQPLTAVSLLTVNKWEAVSGMTLSFRLSEPATIRFFYQLPVRPELVQYSRDTAAYDEIETVLEIDGLRYRETGSYGIVEGSRKSTVQLQGSIIMDLVPGEYSAVLYWKSLLGSSRPWHSSPNALDGFAMGRVLAAVGEWSMDSVSVYHLEQFKPMSVGSTKGIVLVEGDGVEDQLLRFRGDLSAINTALFEIKYKPDKNFNSRQHTEQLGIRVRDFNYLDGTTTDAFKSILLEVQSSDDSVLIVPLELSTITLRGYAVTLLGESNGAKLVHARLLAMTPFGEIQLTTLSSEFPAGVFKLPIGDQPSNSINLTGPVEAISDMLQSVVFVRAPSLYGYEVIFIRLSATSEFMTVEDSTIQLNMNSDTTAEFWLITDVSPSHGRSEGGTVVSVIGGGFRRWSDEKLWCRFGRSPLVPAEVISDTLLDCVSPPVSVEVPKRTFIMVTNGNDFFSNPIPYMYEESWSVTSAFPTEGPRVGGTTARYLLSTTVSCESPKGAQDVLNVSLRLTTNSKDFSQSLTFTYRDSPQVHGINPPYGSSSGGSTIAITGANFFPDEQANCIFNETIVTGLSYKSSRLVLCQSPAVSLSNAVEVSVAVVFDGTQYEAPENFSIYAAPTVAESTPAFITGGGDVLTVSGSYYQNVSSLSAKSPTLGIGAVPFILGNESFSHQLLQLESILLQRTMLAAFEYVVMEPIGIKRVAPVSGLVAGGTNMTVLTDGNFLLNVLEYSSLHCSFGAIVVPAITLNSSALSCYTPPVNKALTVPVGIWTAMAPMHSKQIGSLN
ncbi:hypothetical protein PF006_g5945 [Phytophthora fragariae]|uniref:IPT/TIG domain-containing protein n=1 Tax=Phytophthora fragariae TaxID=53985 RepID=A0A6A3UDG5_9STRA|nr:hypothetical protein PF006_g5945 [Phytophthora fragariae]